MTLKAMWTSRQVKRRTNTRSLIGADRDHLYYFAYALRWNTENTTKQLNRYGKDGLRVALLQTLRADLVECRYEGARLDVAAGWIDVSRVLYETDDVFQARVICELDQWIDTLRWIDTLP